MWMGLIHLIEDFSRIKRWSKEEVGPPELRHHLPPPQTDIYNIGCLVSQAFGLKLELNPWFSWVSGLLAVDAGTSQASIIM